jgi:hypothetical protein
VDDGRLAGGCGTRASLAHSRTAGAR